MNHNNSVDPTLRFSDRVDNYVKYRPSYPQEIISFLTKEIGLSAQSIIADAGSGTGILSKLFLENGNSVYGIEPNDDMRIAAEKILSTFPHFKSLPGSAEESSLDRNSVDFITAGQAFHWFDIDQAKKEFRRILKPGGFVILIWNIRLTDTTPFLIEYEKLLCDFGTDYSHINIKYASDETLIRKFYEPEPYQLKTFNNKQEFDFEGLKGRLLSSSYAPNIGHKNYDSMIVKLKNIFDKHKNSGLVTIEYLTKVFYGLIP